MSNKPSSKPSSKTKYPKLIVGSGKNDDGKKVPVVNGGYLLYMKDVQGMDLDITIMLVENKGWAIDVIGYFAACCLNPNYSMEKSLKMIQISTPNQSNEDLEKALAHFIDNIDKYTEKYANQDWHKLPISP